MSGLGFRGSKLRFRFRSLKIVGSEVRFRQRLAKASSWTEGGMAEHRVMGPAVL